MQRREMLVAAAAAGVSLFDIPRVSAAEDPWTPGSDPKAFHCEDITCGKRLPIQGMGLHFVEFYFDHVPKEIDECRATLGFTEETEITIAAHGV